MSRQSSKKTFLSCFFCLIVVLSGCVALPRTALNVEYSRISNSNDELAIIDFLEKYDFLEFTGLDYDDNRHVSSGVYITYLSSGKNSLSRHMLLVK